MSGREIAIIIRKDGEKFVPRFPVELEEGDQFIVAQEMMGYEVPKGKKITFSGYTSSGPIISAFDEL